MTHRDRRAQVLRVASALLVLAGAACSGANDRNAMAARSDAGLQAGAPAADGGGGSRRNGDAASDGGTSPKVDAGSVVAVDAGGSTDAAVDAGDASTSHALPSAGCSKGATRPAGGVVTVAGAYYLLFPASYDGTKPFPVLIGFHGCGAGNRGTTQDDTEWVSQTRGSGFEASYVRAVPLSSDTGGCWSYDVDVPRVTKMYDDLVAGYCVDTHRVFATGHSSGAQLVVQLLTTQHAADAQHLGLRAVAPVAASDYGPLAAAMPVLYIQGKMDTQRGNGDGHETVARFVAANTCQSSSTPYSAVLGCMSGSTTVHPGCVSYDGCAAPTIWCSHDDPSYSGTMHGIPCFGIQAIQDFFGSLR